jgi:unsaturated chondroitin disaccharide hydrolase
MMRSDAAKEDMMHSDAAKEDMMHSDATKKWAGNALAKCMDKYSWVAEKHRGGIPYTTGSDGSYDNKASLSADLPEGDGLQWWTNGFWGGIMWQLYAYTQDARYADIARVSERLLDQCFQNFYGLHHDVGFMWIPTAVNDWRQTGNPQSRKRALHAANLLAGRYNAAGRYIRAWNDPPGGESNCGWAIIDCMLNIPLLHWASAETQDPRFAHIALAHADTTAEAFIRADGSCSHIVEFDPEKGGAARTHGGQGYRDGSAWTRGQGWAIYGFAISRKLTGKREYLQAAKRVADYFASHIPQSGLIPIDFGQPSLPALEDSCGAAIAACGFVELARLCGDEGGARYGLAALNILHALDERRSDYGSGCDAILSHCSGAYHEPQSHHIHMVYADYFYIEALSKLANGKDTGFIW